MSLTSDTVIKTAHLAQLSLEDIDTQTLSQELNKILNFVNVLQSADTDAVSPLSSPLDMTQPLRADVVTASNERDEMQLVAPETSDGLYLVPPVINPQADK